VLLAEDEPVTRRLMCALLEKWGYEVVAVGRGDEALAVLTSPDPPRMALLDWDMPVMDGPSVCRAVRARVEEPYVYLVLVTGKSAREELLAGLDAGADNYMTKPFDHREFAARLRVGSRIVTLQEELWRAREEMRRAAISDPLTGLLNRGGIFEIFRHEVEQSARTGEPLSIVLADIDHFKAVNDTLGHPVGDVVLQSVARTLAAGVRTADRVGRIGGEEFLLVLPGCDEDEACAVVRRLQARLKAQDIEAGTARIGVTCSYGLATVRGGGDPSRLVADADAALYRAKRGGRDRLEVAVAAEMVALAG
jgi:diguanylate cyclase (GGDEF)-like protein